MSLAHEVTGVRVCLMPTQNETTLIQSVQFFLGIDGVENRQLDVIGFEYGVCEKRTIRGSIKQLGFLLIKNRGINAMTVVDDEGT